MTPPAPAPPRAPSGSPAAAGARSQVFAIHGADPEVLAYAMAKYSRSALSMKESLAEISSQRAEQFLNTFYFEYGHRSIADLAHVAFAVERLSLLAAIELVDEDRWDGQERSTRYQDFLASGWHLPDFGGDGGERELYTGTIEALFAAYVRVSEAVTAALEQAVPPPAGMKQEAYRRTLRARAFDVARYLLPLATNTSLGQIVNARTLEGQVSRLLSSPAAEVRELGEKLRVAAREPAWNLHGEAGRRLAEAIGRLDPALAGEAAALLARDVPVAPTLVKYAQPSEYRMMSRQELGQAAAALLEGVPIAAAPAVDLVEPAGPLEIELAASLLYPVCHHPYRQIRDQVAALDAPGREEIIALGLRHRGRNDEMARAFRAGYGLQFDILMDIGGFRDLHRHRRCVQLMQPFTTRHGYEVPLEADGVGLAGSGVEAGYREAMDRALAASRSLAGAAIPEAEETAKYLLPLGTRCRALFKMDFAEAAYIAELRSAPAGHFSYRRVAWEMAEALRRAHPALAAQVRATDFARPVDIFRR